MSGNLSIGIWLAKGVKSQPSARFSHFMISRALLILALASSFLAAARANAGTAIVISVPDQKLAVIRDGVRAESYPISTSRYGVGDKLRSYTTPLGVLQVVSKIGGKALEGAVFHSRHATGEVLKPNAPGRDPIVTRILWLRGMEKQNANAYERGIYIHGTPQEWLIGRPASFGCVRMKSKDVVKVFNAIPVGTKVEICNERLSRVLKEMAATKKGPEAAG